MDYYEDFLLESKYAYDYDRGIMNRNEYYEALISYSTSQITIECESDSEQENDNYMIALNLYYQIRDISVENINSEIEKANNENLAALLQEVKYVKEYQLLVKRYPKVFLPLKVNLKNKLEKQLSGIKNNEDIVKMLVIGEEAIKTSEPALFLGISLSLIYDRLNRVNEAIELIEKMTECYAGSQLITNHLKKLLRNIYFRNRIYKPYRELLKETGDNVLINLYRNIEFFQFQNYLFVTAYFLVFLFLWIALGYKFLYLFALLVLINLVSIVISFGKKDLLLLNIYVIELFSYFLIAGTTAILYILPQCG